MDTECSQGTGKWIVANEIWEKKGGKKAKAMPDAAQPCAAPVLCQVFGGKNSEKRKIQSRGQAAVQRLADGVAALHGFGAFSPFFTIFSGVSGSATCGLTLPPRLAPRVAFWGKKAKKKDSWENQSAANTAGSSGRAMIPLTALFWVDLLLFSAFVEPGSVLGPGGRFLSPAVTPNLPFFTPISTRVFTGSGALQKRFLRPFFSFFFKIFF